MCKKAEAPSFSVYLGGGVYVGGIVHADADSVDHILLDGAPHGRALVLTFVERAEGYRRDAGVRMCHVARRAGLGAWLVRNPAAAA